MYWKKKKKVKISYKLTPSAKVTFTNKTPKIIKVTTKGVVTGKKKGTFAGVMEKIPYLKELGVTSLEFMPVYEFEELI